MGDALAGFVGVRYNQGIPQYQETGMGMSIANPCIFSGVNLVYEGTRHMQSLPSKRPARLEIS